MPYYRPQGRVWLTAALIALEVILLLVVMAEKPAAERLSSTIFALRRFSHLDSQKAAIQSSGRSPLGAIFTNLGSKRPIASTKSLCAAITW